jgi:putative tricarboxylic transport membrane protein
MVLGILLGIFVGAVPGLTVMMTLAVLLPISFFLPPLIGIPFLLGLFKGGIFGGSISAILVSIPGTAAAIPTCYDGPALSKKGQARKALDVALYASVIGDFSSDIMTVLFVGPIALIALKVGPPELAAIILLSLVIISTVSRGAVVKGLIMASLGLFFSMIGQDPLGFMSRFTFGIFAIKAGIPLVPMLIGAFAIPEILLTVEREATGYISEKIDLSKIGERLRFPEFRRCFRTIMRSTAIGTSLGACPGIGAVVSAFVCYATAKKASKHPETFGKGELEGVAAAEAGNNATNGPTMVPLLTLGIPGDATTALLFGAFMAQGLRPGPMLMQEQGPLVYGILVAMLIANILFLVLGYLTIPLFSRVVQVKKAILLPMICIFAFAGSYVFRSDPFDLLVVVFFGIFGYVARKLHFDIASMVMAFILGPILEFSVGQTLNMVEGSLSYWLFVNRPIAGAILMIIPLLGVLLSVRAIRRRRKARPNNFNLPAKGGGE